MSERGELEEIEAAVRRSEETLGRILVRLDRMEVDMGTISENLAAAAASDAQLQGELDQLGPLVVALNTSVTDLQAQVADLTAQIANAGLPADQVAALQALTDQLGTQVTQVGALLPAAPPPPPPAP